MYAFMIYAAAAIAEITGCFAFWAWMNHGRSPLWLLPGILLLVAFAWLLTLAPTENAGRAYAVYGGIYIVASIGWLWTVDGVRPDRWDLIGSLVCIVGAGIILWGPRTA
jgi:small multidrug resistance family-3 protein